MGSLTAQEIDLLSQFRIKLSDVELEGYKNTDLFLIRWIRAREHKLKDAELMLRKHLEWCKENRIDEILEWEPPEHMSSVYPFEIVGFNNNGCPVVLLPYGRWDLTQAIKRGQKEEFVRYIDQLFEMTEQVIRKNCTEEKQVTQLVLLIDMAGLSFGQLASVRAIDMLLEVVRRFEANHPESLHAAYCINASTVFAMLFKIIKPFMSPNTIGKVEIYKSDPTEWQRVLLNKIPKNQLPKYFGGTGTTSIKMYKENESSDSFEKAEVLAGQKLNLEFDVLSPGSILTWTFRSENHDIGFRIYRNVESTSKETQEEDVVPYQKVESHIRKISGSVNCESKGKYVVVFDNSYSRLRAKIIHHQIVITEAIDSTN